MIIDRQIKKYLVFDEDSILRALEKINANNMRVVFIVNEHGMLKGVLADGDVRRWIMTQQTIDLQKPVIQAANSDFIFKSIDESYEGVVECFSDKIDYVPLVDDRMRLVAVASKRNPLLKVGEHVISDETPCFIIAEIGNNHNGDINIAKTLVDEAEKAGADCVKFQMRNMANLYTNSGNANDASEDLGSQYVLDLLSRFQLSNEKLAEIFDYSNQKGIIPLCTPWDIDSVEFLDTYGIEAYKIASADLTNHDLLTAVVSKGKPLFCSTGMSVEHEIISAISHLRKIGGQCVLLHCNSTYPAPFKDINLRYLKRLEELSGYPVGYSGHERGINIPISAVALGAKVIEKHFTLDRAMEGNDHKVSLLPDEFRDMVKGIREVEEGLGNDNQRSISQGELINRENLAKSLVINRTLDVGELITADMIEVKSPGKGVQPDRKHELIGKAARRKFIAGDFFYPEDFEDGFIEPRKFNFSHPFGVPVRYHDLHSIASACPLDLIEIHLSYKDLELDIHDYFDGPLEHKLVVHSPELFAGDHILDLCTEDEPYRFKSINELQRVIDITRSLKTYFPNAKLPQIVVNAGGFSPNSFLSEDERRKRYSILANSLTNLDQSGIEIILQTMPPYPWHFGGQRYHNLFVSVDETVEFCDKYGYRICLDVSHSKLASNYLKGSLLEFIEKTAHITAHLHIADASGLDGEGLQIGDGEIDFKALMKKLAGVMPQASFIPEIWQGHKNNGQGFWTALDRLEKYSN